MQITRCKITKVIYDLRDEYIRKEMPTDSTYWDINNGHCENFAQEVIRRLTPYGMETDWLYCVVNENFQEKEEWDNKLLGVYWTQVVPLCGLSWEQTNKLRFGHHMWITDGTYHYDAECPEGTKNFFELPIFMRCFKI
jgi:hypothetical protein